MYRSIGVVAIVVSAVTGASMSVGDTAMAVPTVGVGVIAPLRTADGEAPGGQSAGGTGTPGTATNGCYTYKNGKLVPDNINCVSSATGTPGNSGY